jgi:hypothetical protein
MESESTWVYWGCMSLPVAHNNHPMLSHRLDCTDILRVDQNFASREQWYTYHAAPFSGLCKRVLHQQRELYHICHADVK